MKTSKRLLALVLVLCLLPAGRVLAAGTSETQSLPRIGVSSVEALPDNFGPLGAENPGRDLILQLTTKPFYKISKGSITDSVAAMPVDVTEGFAELSKYGISENAKRGYVFRIDLDPNLCWQDGSKITVQDVFFSLRTYAREGTLPLSVAGLSAFLQKAQLPAGDVVSLQEAGYSTVEEAMEAGHQNFYLDVTHFWGLDYGWQPVQGQLVLHDRAIPSGVHEMFITPAYLYRNYLETGRSQDHFQPEFIGVPTRVRTMEESDVGMIEKDPHQMILVLDTPTTPAALAAALADLVILSSSHFGEHYGTSPESYCSYGPYVVTEVTQTQILLLPNEAWRGSYPYDLDEIRISHAS